ncbi:MAG TPA: hypothetical protein VHT34_05465 [Clostridia bacterium]|nr:hypothetical protein [Clostridia bacterium]
MNDRSVKKQLKKLRKDIVINNDLKYKLRCEFNSRRRFGWGIPTTVTAAVLCIVLMVYLLIPDNFVEKVNAASLKVINQASFVDIGIGSSIDSCEYEGIIYTSVFDKGIYKYDSKGYHKIYDKDTNGLSISPDGKSLAFSDGGLKIMDISGGKVSELMKSDDFTYYEDPSWSSDGKYLIYVKKIIAPKETHGFDVKESAIMQMELKTKSTEKLAEGNVPSFVNGQKAIVFEMDNKIIIRDLKKETNKTIDEGRFPSVSPNGEYVAYVKTEKKVEKAAENLSYTENVDNVWISDTNLETKRRVTGNYAVKEDKNALDTMQKNDKLPINVVKSGVYSFYNTSWSSDSNSIYVLKNKNVEGAGMRLEKISFSEYEIAPRDTVRNFLQALVLRDDDYASSLMVDQPPILIASNPHPVGYKIIRSRNENSLVYVDAETYSAYTAQPLYSISRARYCLKKGDDGYRIINIKDLGGIRVSCSEGISTQGEDGSMVIEKGKHKKLLFKESEIPKKFLPEGDFRLASLSYDDQTGTLLFTIQVLQDKGYVRIIGYDVKSGSFKLIDDIKMLNGKYNIGVENLVISPDGKYASIDLFSDDDPASKSYVLVYNLDDSKAIEPAGLLKDTRMDSAHTEFWDQEYLVLEMSSSGQTMRYIYDPVTGIMSGFADQDKK